MRLTELTREHAVKVPPPLFGCSVEEISLAVGEVVGHNHVRSAARMNSAVVIFVDTVEAAELIHINGISVGEHFLPAYALATRDVKVTVSNVPPFIKNEAIVKELSKHGKVVSSVWRAYSGFHSSLQQHVVSHRREVYMIPSDKSRVVNLSFKLTVDDFDYVIFAKTNDFKCYSCGREGHLSGACPGEHGSNRDQNRRRTEGDRGDKQDGQEGTSGAQEARVEETGVVQKVRVEETGVAQKVRVEETGAAQGVRVEERGVAQGVRVEETGGVQEVRVEKTGVTQETRVKETGGVQEVREERMRGGQEVRKDGASEVQQVRESAGGQVEAGGEVAMEADEEQLKAPQRKRKQKGDRGLSQAKKVATTESGGAAECESRLEEDPESGWEDSESSQEDSAVSRGSGGYSVEEVKEFLRRTKNVRKARVEDYLSDKEKLSSSATSHMRSKDRGGLTKQEGFRLKKIVQKVNKELGKGGAKVRLRSQSKDN